MGKKFWRFPIVMVVGASVVVVVAFVFNLWVFSCVPSLHKRFSFNDAFFVEGLLSLILGAMILLRLPHAADVGGRRKLFLGSVLTENANSRGKTAGSTLALGLALIIAAILLFLLSYWTIF